MIRCSPVRALVMLSLATAALALPVPAIAAPSAPVPSSKACAQTADQTDYACLQVEARKVPSGDTATFTGTLSASAMSNLKAWTKGDNIICLTRYPTSAQPDGSWVGTPLEGVCTTVRKDGSFTIAAEFGRKGRYFYGLDMGPCRASADLCGNGDGQLVGLYGKDDKVVALHTT